MFFPPWDQKLVECFPNHSGLRTGLDYRDRITCNCHVLPPSILQADHARPSTTPPTSQVSSYQASDISLLRSDGEIVHHFTLRRPSD